MPPASQPRERRTTGDHVELHQGVRRASGLGFIGYGLFIPLDLYLGLDLYPRASMALVLSARLFGMAALGAVWIWARGRQPSMRALVIGASAAFAGSAMVMGVIAGVFGGLISPYMHGLAFYYAGTAAMVPSPWRRTVAMLVPAHVGFFALLFVTVDRDAVWSWQFHDATALAQAGVHALMETALLVFATISSHLLWVSKAQLYRARRLGRYRLQSPLGAGGMNEVWLARDESLRRDVAIKILRAAPGVGDDRWVRFEREAQATSALISPHTIRIYDYGASDDGIAYIAMEYLRGLDLDDMVRGWGPLDVRRAVYLAKQACLSLAEAHERGLVHRDVKPANLFVLSAGGEVDFLKVLDFGVVRELAAAGADVTRDGMTVGTPTYMAPEQFLGGDVTSASDVYALGATLYFLLTGAPPFDVSGDGRLWRAHAAAPVLPPSLRRGSPVPAALEAVIARCLAKHPDDRYANAAVLRVALDDLPELAPWLPAEAEGWWTIARLGPRPARGGSASSEGATTPSRPISA